MSETKWHRTSLLAGFVATLIASLLVYNPSWKLRIALIVGVGTYLFILLHNPHFWLRRLATGIVTLWLALLAWPSFKILFEWGDLGKGSAEFDLTHPIVQIFPGIVLIGVVFAEILRMKWSEETVADRANAGSPRRALARLQRGKELLRPFVLACLWPRFVRDGFAFFTVQLEVAARTGADILTTAVFENYSRGDKVADKLEKISGLEGAHATVRFTRLVLLDDPTQELKWIRDFLSLKTRIRPQTHKFQLEPTILRVQNDNRPLIRRLVRAIPRVTLTLIRFHAPSKYVVYLGFPMPGGSEKQGFGLAFHSRWGTLYNAVGAFVHAYCDVHGHPFVDRYTDISDLPALRPSIDGLPMRIIDSLREMAAERKEIHHISLFGSTSLVYSCEMLPGAREEHEADLDFIIVVERRCDLDKMKEDISRGIFSQKLPEDPEITIEWSNIERRYYEYRQGLHVDIQLHEAGDQYYANSARLLGYAIFPQSCTVLYSRDNMAIQDFLATPEDMLGREARAQLALESPEFGIYTAAQRLRESGRVGVTDPRRVLWISVGNLVWALSGARPLSRHMAFSYLRECHGQFDVQESFSKRVDRILSSHFSAADEQAAEAMKESASLLESAALFLKGTLA